MSFRHSEMRRHLAIVRIFADIIASPWPETAEGRIEDRRVPGHHAKFLEVLARCSGECVQHVRLASFVQDVVEERAELRACQFRGDVSYSLYQLLNVQL